MAWKMVFFALSAIVLLEGTVRSTAGVVPVGTGDSPDITDALKLFGNGGFDIDKLKSLYQEFDLALSLIKEFEKASPFVRTITQETSKKNIKFQIVNELINGKYPDLGQLFKLATTKTDSVEADFNSTAAKYPGFDVFTETTDGNFTNPNVLRKLVQFMIGKSLSKQFTDTDPSFAKLLKIAIFIESNTQGFITIHKSINRANTTAIFVQLKLMNWDKLLSELTPGSKYSVSSPNQRKKTDALVGDMRKEWKVIQTTPSSSSQAGKEAVKMMKLLANLGANLLEEVASAADKAP